MLVGVAPPARFEWTPLVSKEITLVGANQPTRCNRFVRPDGSTAPVVRRGYDTWIVPVEAGDDEHVKVSLKESDGKDSVTIEG